MVYFSWLMLAGLLTPGRTYTAFQESLLNLGPVAYWRMEGNLISAPQPIVTTFSGGAAIYASSASPQLSKALVLSGSQYAIVPYFGSLNPLSFTVLFWVSVTGGDGTFRALIGSRNTDMEKYSYGFNVFCGQTNTFVLYMSQGTGGKLNPSDSGILCRASVWNFVAVTFDFVSKTAKMYINGKLSVNTQAPNFSPNTVNSFVMSGRRNNPSVSVDSMFSGLLDEVAVFNRTLSATSISMIYGLGGNTAVTGYTPYQKRVLLFSPVVYLAMEGALSTAPRFFNKSCSGVVTYAPSASTQLSKALVLQGSVSISVPFNLQMNPPSFTVLFWASVTGGNNTLRVVVGTMNLDRNTSFGYTVYCGQTNTWGLDMSQGERGGMLHLDSGVQCQASAWNFIAVTFDNLSGSVQMFVNGQVKINNAVPNFVPNSSNKFVLSGRCTSSPAITDSFFTGLLDEVAFFNYSMHSLNITSLYMLGLQSIPSNPGNNPVNQPPSSGNPAPPPPPIATSPPSLGPVLTGFQLAITNIGPSVYWKMEGSLTTGLTSVNTTYHGSALYQSSVFPQLSKALTFQGSQYAQVPYLALLNPTSFTLLLWVSVTGGTGSNRVVAGAQNTNLNTYSFGYSIACSQDNTWVFYVGQALKGGLIPFDSNVHCETAIWYFIAASFDGISNSVKVYINGQMKVNATAEVSNFLPNTKNSFVMGASSSSPTASVNSMMTGLLDEVAIFDRVLGSVTITSLYNLGISTSAGSPSFQGLTFSVTLQGLSVPSITQGVQTAIVQGLSSLFQVAVSQIKLQVVALRRKLCAVCSQKLEVVLSALTNGQAAVVQITVGTSADKSSIALLSVLKTAGLNVTASSLAVSYPSWTTPVTNTQPKHSPPERLRVASIVVIAVASFTGAVVFVVCGCLVKRQLGASNKAKVMADYSSPLNVLNSSSDAKKETNDVPRDEGSRKSDD